MFPLFLYNENNLNDRSALDERFSYSPSNGIFRGPWIIRFLSFFLSVTFSSLRSLINKDIVSVSEVRRWEYVSWTSVWQSKVVVAVNSSTILVGVKRLLLWSQSSTEPTTSTVSPGRRWKKVRFALRKKTYTRVFRSRDLLLLLLPWKRTRILFGDCTHGRVRQESGLQRESAQTWKWDVFPFVQVSTSHWNYPSVLNSNQLVLNSGPKYRGGGTGLPRSCGKPGGLLRRITVHGTGNRVVGETSKTEGYDVRLYVFPLKFKFCFIETVSLQKSIP